MDRTSSHHEQIFKLIQVFGFIGDNIIFGCPNLPKVMELVGRSDVVLAQIKVVALGAFVSVADNGADTTLVASHSMMGCHWDILNTRLVS